MNVEQINKSIGQMRQIFAFCGIVYPLGLGYAADRAGTAGCVSIPLILGSLLLFWSAFAALGKRSRPGHTLAELASIALLVGFPIFTIFGISYLSKLSKPEMKRALAGDV